MARMQGEVPVMRVPRVRFAVRRMMIVAAMSTGILGLSPQKPIRVGQVAPPVVALTPDGNFDIQSYYQGRYVLLTFWSLQDRESIRQLEELKKIRRGITKRNRLLILSVCTDDPEAHHECWLRFLEAQGMVDYGDRDRRGPFHFYMDHKWVNAAQDGSNFVSSEAYGVERLPAAFLIGPDGRLRAIRIPVDKMGAVVAEALKEAP